MERYVLMVSKCKDVFAGSNRLQLSTSVKILEVFLLILDLGRQGSIIDREKCYCVEIFNKGCLEIAEYVKIGYFN